MEPKEIYNWADEIEIDDAAQSLHAELSWCQITDRPLVDFFAFYNMGC